MPASAPDAAQAGSWTSLLVVLAAALASAAGFGWSCWVRSWCDGRRHVRGADGRGRGVAQCSFATVVPLLADLLYHNATTSTSLQALTRGVCGVGERLHLSTISGHGRRACYCGRTQTRSTRR